MAIEGLVAPVGANFIKDWVTQNGSNCDKMDSFTGPQSIQSYIPEILADTTNPNLGAGSATGFYWKIFDFVYTWGEFRFGTGFSKGVGQAFRVTLPFKVKTNIAINGSPGDSSILGNGWAFDTSAGTRHSLIAQTRTSNQLYFQIRGDTAFPRRTASPDDDIPVTWASGDGITWFARYQRDTA
jgi:hypothetical protein